MEKGGDCRPLFLTGEVSLTFLAGLLLPALGFLRHCQLSPPSSWDSRAVPTSPVAAAWHAHRCRRPRLSQGLAYAANPHTRCRLWTRSAQCQAQTSIKSQNSHVTCSSEAVAFRRVVRSPTRSSDRAASDTADRSRPTSSSTC